MSKRGSNNGGLGCLTLMLYIIAAPVFFLATSRNEDDKKGAGAIIIGILLFVLLGLGGASSLIALIFILMIVAVFLGITGGFFDSLNPKQNYRTVNEPTIKKVKPKVDAITSYAMGISETRNGMLNGNFHAAKNYYETSRERNFDEALREMSSQANELEPGPSKIREILLEQMKLREIEQNEVKPKKTKSYQVEFKETKPKETKPYQTEVKETNPKETKPKETNPKETESKKITSPIRKTFTTGARSEKRYFSSVQEAVEEFNIPEDFSKIVIEGIKHTDVKECPGLLWVKDDTLFVLPLIKPSKIYEWPLSSIPLILFEKMSNQEPEEQYCDMNEEVIAQEFDELFPEYFFDNDGTYTGKFMLPVGLEVTNRSGKVLFEKLKASFYMVDEVTQSTEYDKAIKELYQQYILWKQGIIDGNEYDEYKKKCLADYKAQETDSTRFESQLAVAEELGLV